MASEIDFSQMPAAPPAAPSGGGSEIDFSQMPSSTAEDTAKGVESGAIIGTAGLARVPGAVTKITQKPLDVAGNWLGRQLGDWFPSQENIEKYYAAHPELPKPPGVGGRATGGELAGEVGAGAVTGIADPLAAAAGLGTSTYRPTTTAGRFGQTAGAFLPNLALGPEGLALRGIGGRVLGQVLAPAAGAEAGGALAPQLGLSEETGRTLGALGVGGVAGAALPSVTPELAGAAETLGTQLPAAATSGAIARALGWLTQKVPIAGAPLTGMVGRATRQATTGVGTALEEAGALPAEQAGQLFKDTYSDWNTGELNPSTTTMWNRVSAATDQSVQSPLSNTAAWAQQVQAARARSGLSPSPAVNDLANALAMPGGMAFDDMKRLRSDIGSKMSPSVTPVGTNAAEYEQAYKMLTQDMGQAALRGGGQPAYDLWQQAVNTYKTNLGRQQAVAKIIGLDGNAPPERVVAQLQKMAAAKGGDIGSLTNVQEMIGSLNKAHATIGDDIWTRLAGSVAQNMGTNASGDLDLALLQKNYNALSDAGRQALFPAGSPLRTALDAVGPVTQSLQGLGKGFSLGAHGIGGGVAAIAMEHLLENPITALKVGAPALPVSLLLSTPATASSLGKYLTMYRAETMAGRLGQGAFESGKMLQAARNLANTTKSQLGYDMDPNRVIQALPLQAPAQTDEGQSQ